MPFSGYDLMTRIAGVHKDFAAPPGRRRDPARRRSSRRRAASARRRSRSTSRSPSASSSQRTVLIDGSLQFGDLRALLRVPVDAPSILDLPTDRIAESDLADVLWRDPSGIDILLAPPRIEMAEMVTLRDLEKMLSLLRRVYDAIVIDMSSAAQRHEPGVPRRERHDHRDRDLRLDDDPQHDRHGRHVPVDRLPGDRRSSYLVNRADAPAASTPRTCERALGRVPEHRVVSDGHARRPLEQRGRAVRPGRPERAGEPGHQSRIAAELLGAGAGRRPAAGRPLGSPTCPTRDPSASSTPGSAA